MAIIESREYVLKQVREAGVKLIRLWFTDIWGHLKEVAVTAQQLEAVLEDGLNIDTRAGRHRKCPEDCVLEVGFCEFVLK